MKTGFTLIEMMVVLGVIAILALMFVPNYMEQYVRQQILEAVSLADLAKAPVAASWSGFHAFPRDNAAAGLPPADRMVNNYISSVAVEDGAIQITFGNSANSAIKGKILSIRPAVVEDAPIVPVAWVCGNAQVPGKMVARGENRTNIPSVYLPANCRGRGTGS